MSVIQALPVYLEDTAGEDSKMEGGEKKILANREGSKTHMYVNGPLTGSHA